MGRLQGARVGGRGGSTTTPTGAERTLPRVQEGGGMHTQAGDPRRVPMSTHVGWDEHGVLLAGALCVVEKLVPAKVQQFRNASGGEMN